MSEARRAHSPEAPSVPSSECSFLSNEACPCLLCQTVLRVVLRASVVRSHVCILDCHLMAAPESGRFIRLGLRLISVPLQCLPVVPHFTGPNHGSFPGFPVPAVNAVIVLLSGVSPCLTTETTQAVLIRRELVRRMRCLQSPWRVGGWALSASSSRHRAQQPSGGGGVSTRPASPALRPRNPRAAATTVGRRVTL